jgi:hypothetical protein
MSHTMHVERGAMIASDWGVTTFDEGGGGEMDWAGIKIEGAAAR